jgi:hypothetical protein
MGISMGSQSRRTKKFFDFDEITSDYPTWCKHLGQGVGVRMSRNSTLEPPT